MNKKVALGGYKPFFLHLLRSIVIQMDHNSYFQDMQVSVLATSTVHLGFGNRTDQTSE